jgi:hypothetical protein
MERRTVSARTQLFIVVTGDWGGDLQGVLCSPDEALWQHISSNEDWLARDLTVGFSHRRAELEKRYPDGYDVEFVPPGQPVPVPIAHLFRQPA